MKLIGFAAIVAALLFPAIDTRAEPSQGEAQVGDTYEITMIRESSQQSGEGSSGSSYDKDTIIERVIGVRADGLELEYDLPKASTAEARADNWQFPARVFRPHSGPLQLLNRSELEARVEAWLKTTKLTRAACGHWIFTWNAFRIECDPQSVIQTLGSFDLRSPDLRDGALYREPEALDPAPVARKAAGPDGATFIVEMKIDPDAVRRGRAEGDVVVAEIIGKPLTLDAALRERMKEGVSGTISVTFETDPAEGVRRRTKVTELKINRPDGRLETDTGTETVERRPLSRRAVHR